VKLTARELRAKEDAILDGLEHSPGDRTFLNTLYRDGVPTPAAYLAQPVRVLFVFREPNMRGRPCAHDMRDEVSDARFRPLGRTGTREERSPRSWWNNKVGLFAHAVAAALEGEPEPAAFARFKSVLAGGEWNHEVVNRFAYIQVKKIGGGGTSNAREICAYAERCATILRQQVELYRPHLVIGCGVGKDSPARLFATYVLPGGQRQKTSVSRAAWWRFPSASRPTALVQLYHPSWRGARSDLHRDVFNSVREVARNVGVCRQP
jgi:hypothetical protein